MTEYISCLGYGSIIFMCLGCLSLTFVWGYILGNPDNTPPLLGIPAIAYIAIAVLLKYQGWNIAHWIVVIIGNIPLILLFAGLYEFALGVIGGILYGICCVVGIIICIVFYPLYAIFE